MSHGGKFAASQSKRKKRNGSQRAQNSDSIAHSAKAPNSTVKVSTIVQEPEPLVNEPKMLAPLSPRKQTLLRRKICDRKIGSPPLHRVRESLRPSHVTSGSSACNMLGSLPSHKEDKLILFKYASSRITVYDENVSLNSRSSGCLLGHGEIEVFQLHLGNIRYLSCGHSFVYPLLPRLRVLRISFNEFVIPLFNPERYWRIQIDSTQQIVIGALESILKKIVSYRNLYSTKSAENGDTVDLSLTSNFGFKDVDVNDFDDINDHLVNTDESTILQTLNLEANVHASPITNCLDIHVSSNSVSDIPIKHSLSQLDISLLKSKNRPSELDISLLKATETCLDDESRKSFLSQNVACRFKPQADSRCLLSVSADKEVNLHSEFLLGGIPHSSASTSQIHERYPNGLLKTVDSKMMVQANPQQYSAHFVPLSQGIYPESDIHDLNSRAKPVNQSRCEASRVLPSTQNIPPQYKFIDLKTPQWQMGINNQVLSILEVVDSPPSLNETPRVIPQHALYSPLHLESDLLPPTSTDPFLPRYASKIYDNSFSYPGNLRIERRQWSPPESVVNENPFRVLYHTCKLNRASNSSLMDSLLDDYDQSVCIAQSASVSRTLSQVFSSVSLLQDNKRKSFSQLCGTSSVHTNLKNVGGISSGTPLISRRSSRSDLYSSESNWMEPSIFPRQITESRSVYTIGSGVSLTLGGESATTCSRIYESLARKNAMAAARARHISSRKDINSIM